jgi:hypothetical protein
LRKIQEVFTCDPTQHTQTGIVGTFSVNSNSNISSAEKILTYAYALAEDPNIYFVTETTAGKFQPVIVPNSPQVIFYAPLMDCES